MTTVALSVTAPAMADAYDRADTRRRTRAILVGSMGNLIEWFDVYAYAAFALYFAPAFFPNGDPVAQQLAAATIFAVGFIARPFGSVLLGHVADRYGRRRALIWAVLLMCLGSLLIAITPTYATIGIGAPIVLTSGHDEEEALSRIGEPAHSAFLQKPFTPDELLAALRDAIGG